MEALCEDCPMRNFGGIDLTWVVNVCRMRIEDRGDREKVAALSAGEVLLSALEKPRPERCAELRDNLPRVRRTSARRVMAIACAEMHLVAETHPDWPDPQDKREKFIS
jgi:hypothetical protein